MRGRQNTTKSLPTELDMNILWAERQLQTHMFLCINAAIPFDDSLNWISIRW